MLQRTVVTQHNQPVVETRDPLARHAEELLRARYSPVVADRCFEWPETGVNREGFRDKEVIVSRVEGVVVGRAILDAAFYPLAELENLEVHVPFRNRDVASAIVQHAVETASRAGFIAIHSQIPRDDVPTQRLYANHGFLPATNGEMLRVWRFLNLPALSQFVYDHPMALFDSRGAPENCHILRWWDSRTGDELTVTISGGSCQSDSFGVGPAVSRLQLRSGCIDLAAAFICSSPIQIGHTLAAQITLANEGSDELSGGFRIGLNPGFSVASGHPGGEQFLMRPGEVLERTVEIVLDSGFPTATLDICAYRSIPISVDFLLGDHTFWLIGQALVSGNHL